MVDGKQCEDNGKRFILPRVALFNSLVTESGDTSCDRSQPESQPKLGMMQSNGSHMNTRSCIMIGSRSFGASANMRWRPV